MDSTHTLRTLALTIAFSALALTGCGKIKLPFLTKLRKATPTPAPAAVASGPVATPAPTAPAPTPKAEAKPKPARTAVDTHAEVIVLCYHRLEGKAGGALSIEPAVFEKQMQEIKDAGLAVIPMQDFLAWRRGEKNIPAKSVIITIDDGYVSGYSVGVPILKKFGFPATFFIYTNYLNTGGKSMTWSQLDELRDAGFDIGCHTVSHIDLRHKPAKWSGDYESWLKDEVERSKKILEDHLGIRCATIAYPFGSHNTKVHDAVKAAGYEAAFTTYGARLGMTTNPFTLGRYDVTTKDAQGRGSFSVGISFEGMAAPSGDPVMAQDAASSMVTQPLNNEIISNAKPTLSANLATMGDLDAGTVEMRLSGVGLVPAKFDEATSTITYTPAQPLPPGRHTVIINAKSAGRRVETRWGFTIDPNAKDTGTPQFDIPPPEAIPAPSKPAKPGKPAKR